MTLPVWILAPAVLCWGWLLGVPALAIPMAVLVVAPAFVRHRFPLTRFEFHRAFDVAWVLVFGGLLLIYSRESMGNVLRGCVQWLPVMAFPAVLAQAWSEAGRVPATALLPWPAWRRHEDPEDAPVDLGPPYVVGCLLAMSTTGGGRPWFYIPLFLLVALLLWVQRARAVSPSKVVALLVVTGAGGWFVALGLGLFQQWVETGMLEWSVRWQRDHAPLREARTAIGTTGRVGGSSRVILRLRDDGLRPLPSHLRIATYSEWDDREEMWIAPVADFEKVEGVSDEWILAAGTNRLSGFIEAEWSQDSTDGLLPVPSDTRVLRDLAADKVERTRFGAVRVDMRPGIVGFRADLAPFASWESEPTLGERSGIPDHERDVIQQVAAGIGVQPGVSTDQALENLQRFFRSEFKYTTDLVDLPSDDPRARTPLSRFLLGHRTGHCEYFATAAVLLLRAAKIPTRYATGYLVDPDARENAGVTVRESQAHAWVRVWNGAAWQDFDPTPPSDGAGALSGTGWWGRLERRWSAMRFTISRWWWLGEKPLLRQAYWLTVPLLAALLWRFRKLRASTGNSVEVVTPAGFDRQGMDSEWIHVEAHLAVRGWARRDRESLAGWQARLAASGWPTGEIGCAASALSLHERLRFDPVGLGTLERHDLRRHARQILERFVTGSVAARPDADATKASIQDPSDSDTTSGPNPAATQTRV